jgi:hypothetical protein
MFADPQSHDTSTPHQNRPSKSIRSPSSGFGRTPSKRMASLGSARVSPYAVHRKVSPMGSPVHTGLFTPKEHMAKKAAIRNRTPNSKLTASSPSPMGPPSTRRVVSATDTPTRGRPPSRLFPSSQQLLKMSALQATVRMFDPPRGEQRPRDRGLPTVQLLRVLNKCWSDDTEKQKNVAVVNSSKERCEELDRSAMWDSLGHAIHNVWPNLKAWAMNYIPREDNSHWFTSEDLIGDNETCDPDIATKHSSSERVGFFSTFSSSPPDASSK